MKETILHGGIAFNDDHHQGGFDEETVKEEKPESKLTSEEVKNLSKPVKFSDKAKRIIFQNGINAVNTLITSPLVVHYDEVRLEADMSLYQVGEYRKQTGDLILMEKEVDKAAEVIIKNKEAAIRDSIKNFLAILEGRKKNQPNLWHIYSEILDSIYEALSEKDCLRNDIIDRLGRFIAAKMAQIYLDEINKPQYSQTQRESLNKHLIKSTLKNSSESKGFVEITSFNFPFYYIAYTIEYFEKTKRNFPEYFEKAVEKGKDGREIKALKENNDQLYEEISDLLPFVNKINMIEEGFEMTMLGNKILGCFTFPYIDMNRVEKLGKDAEMDFVDSFINPGKINFALSSDGVFKLPFADIQLSKIVGYADSEALRGYVLNRLAWYLDRELNPAKKQSVESIQDDARAALQKDNPVFNLDETEEAPSSRQRKSYLKLKGFSGNRILAALKTLMGEPLRISGSHYIFKGLNGKTYPIALHGSKRVGLGMLMKSLKNWDLSPQLLLEKIS